MTHEIFSTLFFCALQMGIMDIFEPTKADFSQLANDKTLYVKNVEQTININIRTAQSVEALKSEYRRELTHKSTFRSSEHVIVTNSQLLHQSEC